VKEFSYEIGGNKFTQKALVLGQISQLLEVLKGLALPADMSPLGLVAALGGRLPKALAVVLNPDGVAIKDKDLAVLGEHIAFEMEADLAIRVIDDFFDCNPLSSTLARLTDLVKRRSGGNGSISSASSSLKETSPAETQSSGATH
jgi:hypothetical protein